MKLYEIKDKNGNSGKSILQNFKNTIEGLTNTIKDNKFAVGLTTALTTTIYGLYNTGTLSESEMLVNKSLNDPLIATGIVGSAILAGYLGHSFSKESTYGDKPYDQFIGGGTGFVAGMFLTAMLSLQMANVTQNLDKNSVFFQETLKEEVVDSLKKDDLKKYSQDPVVQQAVQDLVKGGEQIVNEKIIVVSETIEKLQQSNQNEKIGKSVKYSKTLKQNIDVLEQNGLKLSEQAKQSLEKIGLDIANDTNKKIDQKQL